MSVIISHTDELCEQRQELEIVLMDFWYNKQTIINMSNQIWVFMRRFATLFLKWVFWSSWPLGPLPSHNVYISGHLRGHINFSFKAELLLLQPFRYVHLTQVALHLSVIFYIPRIVMKIVYAMFQTFTEPFKNK